MKDGRVMGKYAPRPINKIVDFMIDTIADSPGIVATELFELSKSIWNNLSEKQARKRFLDNISALEKRGFIRRQAPGMSGKIVLTKAGNKRLEGLAMSRIGLSKSSKWDGYWRVVSFDIPEEKRTARDAVRRLLKEIGCAHLHDSVWIHPLDFSMQIASIQQIYGVKNHITYMTLKSFDREEEFKAKFRHTIKPQRP